MALPPTVPTSFVPHPASSDARRNTTDVLGAFAFFAYFVFAVAVLSAFGVFGYNSFLASQEALTTASLQKAAAELDPATVANFVRLRDRLSSGGMLLKNHTAFSGLFSQLDETTPKTVRFSKIHVALDAENKATLSAAGTAKTFNALASASNAFAQEGRIRDAIFSNISIGQTGGIGFDLAATLDSALIAFTVPLAQASPTPSP